MKPDDLGDFVQAADYDTLRAQLEVAERLAQAFADTLTISDARAEAAEANAARYLSLRDSGKFAPSVSGEGWGLAIGGGSSVPASLLDAAIDAAIARTKEETNHG